jgi:hypothetical protein
MNGTPTLEQLAPKIDEARRAGFSDDEILKEIAPLFPNINNAVKQGFNSKQILDEISPRSYVTTGEVISGAVQNFPSSMGNLIKSIYDAVTNPLATAKSVLDVGAGALQNTLPDRFVQFVGEDKASRDVARSMGQFFADRYGTGEKLKQTIATDPAGVLADLSTLISGGAGATRVAADVATIATKGRVTAPLQAAEALSKTATFVDPLAATLRGGGAVLSGTGRLGSEVLGITTGAGREPIAQAFRAGREGGETAEVFRQNLRRQTDITEVVTEARNALQDLRTNRQANYRSGMVNISKDKTILDFTGIDSAISTAEGRTKFKGQVKNQEAFDALQNVRTKVDEWKKLNPADYHTPEGLDALKQTIGAELEKLDPKTNAYNTVNDVYKAIRSEIVKQAPVYSNVMSAYSKASDQILELEKAFNLKDKTSIDTTLRKLLTTMRDNVNANFGQRLNLVQELDKTGKGKIVPALAGISLSQITPRGLQRMSTLPTAGAIGYFVDPFAAGGSLLASSPRAVGELAYGAGTAARQVGNVIQASPIGPISPFLVNPQLYNYLYQAGQIQGQTE